MGEQVHKEIEKELEPVKSEYEEAMKKGDTKKMEKINNFAKVVLRKIQKDIEPLGSEYEDAEKEGDMKKMKAAMKKAMKMTKEDGERIQSRFMMKMDQEDEGMSEEDEEEMPKEAERGYGGDVGAKRWKRKNLKKKFV